jgi:hypothetical protein
MMPEVSASWASIVVVAEPPDPRHAATAELAAALRAAFGTGWSVRVGAPIALDDSVGARA